MFLVKMGLNVGETGSIFDKQHMQQKVLGEKKNSIICRGLTMAKDIGKGSVCEFVQELNSKQQVWAPNYTVVGVHSRCQTSGHGLGLNPLCIIQLLFAVTPCLT